MALSLFLAGWLNLLVQPCLMAAPVDDCYGSAAHRLSMHSSGSEAFLSDSSGIEISFAADCETIQSCADRDNSYPVISGSDPKYEFVAVAMSAEQFQVSPVSFYLPPIYQTPVFSRVPLFIQNNVFLI